MVFIIFNLFFYVSADYVHWVFKPKVGIGWGLLGCCIPIVGLVLFLVWKDTKPKTAKAAGIGALVAVILGVIWYILVIVLGIAGAAMM